MLLSHSACLLPPPVKRSALPVSVYSPNQHDHTLGAKIEKQNVKFNHIPLQKRGREDKMGTGKWSYGMSGRKRLVFFSVLTLLLVIKVFFGQAGEGK